MLVPGGEAQLVQPALDFYLRLRSRADVRALYDGGRMFFEVPFTSAAMDVAARGVIDCIVAHPARDVPAELGRVGVIEFKTGSPRPEHHQQVGVYRLAAAAAFPDADVQAWLVYGTHVESL
jgi:hypothetical protein